MTKAVMIDGPIMTLAETEVARLAMCAGKETFSDRSLAERIARRRNRGDRKMSVYKCVHCRKFHMGQRAEGLKR